MNIIRKFTFLIFSAMVVTTAIAQSKSEFINPEIHLGEVQWNTSATANFKLKNSGNKPLQIVDVKTDCGCTMMAWTKNAIQPGQVVNITATYDAATLGKFEKQVRVSTSDGTPTKYLKLKGKVVREQRMNGSNFPFKIGELRLSTDNIEFDDINRGECYEQTIFVYNGTQMNYAPELMHLPKYLSVTAEPKEVRPGHIGKIRISLNSNELHDFGLTQTNIYLARFPGDKVSKATEIGVSATLLPQFAFTSAELASAPAAKIDTLIDLGSFGKKTKLEGQLTLTNSGHSTLKVTTLQVYNLAISVSLSKTVIKPGEKAKLQITASSNSDLFKGDRKILLITNDPHHSKIVVEVQMKK